MIICSRHWDRLRRMICECGMAHLLHHPHGEFEELAAELCGRVPRHCSFDPLTRSRSVAEQLAIDYGGPYLAQGASCPICGMVNALPTGGIDPERYWPETVVRQVEQEARARGLMPRAA